MQGEDACDRLQRPLPAEQQVAGDPPDLGREVALGCRRERRDACLQLPVAERVGTGSRTVEQGGGEDQRRLLCREARADAEDSSIRGEIPWRGMGQQDLLGPPTRAEEGAQDIAYDRDGQIVDLGRRRDPGLVDGVPEASLGLADREGRNGPAVVQVQMQARCCAGPGPDGSSVSPTARPAPGIQSRSARRVAARNGGSRWQLTQAANSCPPALKDMTLSGSSNSRGSTPASAKTAAGSCPRSRRSPGIPASGCRAHVAVVHRGRLRSRDPRVVLWFGGMASNPAF